MTASAPNDGILRVIFKSIVLLRYWLDMWLWRAWYYYKFGKPSYDLQGKCDPCGKCCEHPTVTVPKMLFRFPQTMSLFLWWQRVINRFELVSMDLASQQVIFTCGHYDSINKTCNSYKTRPGMCRDYPNNLRFAERPVLFDECSYVLVNRLDVRLDAAMEKANLPQETIDEIRRKLNQKQF